MINKSFQKLSSIEFLNKGIPAGMIIGLFSYLITSKAHKSTKIGLGSFGAITMGYFINCRREFDAKLEQNKELGEIMNMIIRYRGTELENQLQEQYKKKLEEIDKKSKYI